MERKNRTLYAPSILSANFSRLSSEMEKINRSGADWVHLDVMDGRFVPNITFGPKLVKDLRPLSSLPFDVHLMIVEPEKYVDEFADAGADYLTFHMEATVHAHRVIQMIKKRGLKAGISIVPSTPVSHLDELLPILDLVLVMTVNPGFGGQEIIPTCLKKVTELKMKAGKREFPYLVAVDGGVNRKTAGEVRGAGADVLVSGSAFFRAEDPAEEVRVVRDGL
jgi:ribulose-phosphate 3-epimerase